MLKKTKKIPVLEVNSLNVNHYFQLGSLYATCKKVRDLAPDDVVIVLEKTNKEAEGKP